MNLEPGRTLLHYRIVDKLGEGGMGVVWKAIDTNLDREVAIKGVPDLFVGDADRLARFEREAKLLACLDHPHIATVYGLHEAEGVRFFAMELVDGEDLSERLARGPLPLEDVLELARKIAAALESAHDNGVIHRDLKPANIKIGSGGKVKVLDFGLAKAFEPSPASSGTPTSLSASPTLTSAGTRAGVILGTAAYMSPEQARGLTVDQRSDIWSFGCVLFEMLTGRSVFGGTTVSDSIAAILRGEPDWNSLPRSTPRAIRRLLARCLAKSPAHRLRHVGDAILEIDAGEEDSLAGIDPIDPIEAPAVPAATASSLRGGAPWLVMLLLIAIAFWGPWRDTEPVDDDVPLHLSVRLPSDAPLAPAGAMPFGVGMPSFATTPDGTRLVYVGLVDGRRQLHVREMTTGEVTPLPGTEDGFGPFVSPDGKSAGYFAREKLLRVSLEGGQPELLADAVFPFGGVWTADGQIYFAPREGHGIYRVPAAGGPAVEIMKRIGDGQAWPQILPGGEMLLVSGFGGSTRIVPLANPEQSRVLIPSGVDARWVSTGHLLYSRAGRLMAVGFDLDDYRVIGEPLTLVHEMRTESTNFGQYSISENGTLVYAAGFDARSGFLTWADRDGGHERLALPRRSYGSFDVSHHGDRVALPIIDGDAEDIWIYDFGRLETPTRLTFTGSDRMPIWSNDDQRLFYGTGTDDDRNDLVTQSVETSDRHGTFLVAGNPSSMAGTVTPDGRELVFSRTSEQTSMDLWRAPIETDGGTIALGEPTLLAGTEHLEIFPTISPDGEWIAYTSDETGRWEIYVATYPEMARRVRVSADGGEEPRFSPDGSELIYRWGSQWFVSDVTREPEFRCGPPRLLFEGPYINVAGYSWDISADGRRFLVIEGPEQNEALTELVVLTDFLDRLP